MPEIREYRTFEMKELRAEKKDSGTGKLVGYAAVFNSLSEVMYDFREVISPGAFTETIKNDDIRALFNHSSDYVLGRNRAGTLKLLEDQNGLAIEIDMPDTQIARDLMVSVQRGDITQMSFGFDKISDKWENIDGNTIRTLTKVKLYDVSPVTFPAYPETVVTKRSQEIFEEAKNSGRIPEAAGAAEGARSEEQRLMIAHYREELEYEEA